MYGPRLATSRRVGVLNAPLSASFLVTRKRPRSGVSPSMPTPILRYPSSVKLKPAWQRVHEALPSKSASPRRAEVDSAAASPALKRSYGELPETIVRAYVALALATPSASRSRPHA